MVLEHTALRQGKLLTFLRRELGLSSTLVGNLKQNNRIFVNSQAVFTNHMVKIGDTISADLAEPYPDFPPEPMDLSILYEDDAIIALDKPPGLLMHPTANRQSGTLANGLLHYYMETGQPCGIHPISRLDRDTFGVVLFAKNGHVHHLMTGEIQKTYRGLVWGRVLASQGTVTLPIARKPDSLFRQISQQGQFAKTVYRVLEVYTDTTLLELRPITGRTHQLRLHCKSLGHPMVGEPYYGWKKGSGQRLLAYEIQFSHPLTQAPMTITSQQQCHTTSP